MVGEPRDVLHVVVQASFHQQFVAPSEHVALTLQASPGDGIRIVAVSQANGVR